MKIDLRSLKFANYSIRNRSPPIPFYIPEKKKKLSPPNYQVYKPQTNYKDKKSVVYSITVKYYEVGTPEEWLQLIDVILQVIKGHDSTGSETAYTLVKSLLWGDILQVFQNEEIVHAKRDNKAFTKCLATVTKH
eukprot:11269549-Ditylum_brightwellii.AAC.1